MSTGDSSLHDASSSHHQLSSYQLQEQQQQQNVRTNELTMQQQTQRRFSRGTINMSYSEDNEQDAYDWQQNNELERKTSQSVTSDPLHLRVAESSGTAHHHQHAQPQHYEQSQTRQRQRGMSVPVTTEQELFIDDRLDEYEDDISEIPFDAPSPQIQSLPFPPRGSPATVVSLQQPQGIPPPMSLATTPHSPSSDVTNPMSPSVQPGSAGTADVSSPQRSAPRRMDVPITSSIGGPSPHSSQSSSQHYASQHRQQQQQQQQQYLTQRHPSPSARSASPQHFFRRGDSFIDSSRSSTAAKSDRSMIIAPPVPIVIRTPGPPAQQSRASPTKQRPPIPMTPRGQAQQHSSPSLTPVAATKGKKRFQLRYSNSSQTAAAAAAGNEIPSNHSNYSNVDPHFSPLLPGASASACNSSNSPNNKDDKFRGLSQPYNMFRQRSLPVTSNEYQKQTHRHARHMMTQAKSAYGSSGANSPQSHQPNRYNDDSTIAEEEVLELTSVDDDLAPPQLEQILPMQPSLTTTFNEQGNQQEFDTNQKRSLLRPIWIKRSPRQQQQNQSEELQGQSQEHHQDDEDNQANGVRNKGDDDDSHSALHQSSTYPSSSEDSKGQEDLGEDDDDASPRQLNTSSTITGPRRRSTMAKKPSGQRDPMGDHDHYDTHPNSIGDGGESSIRDIDEGSLVKRKNLHYILYLSIFAMFGSILRIFLARLFGYDCENYPNNVIQDWLTPLSKHVCVTASGQTEQTGGALFVDLPANMLGSFVMGIMTSLSDDWPALPWLRADHPLQRYDPLKVAITTGMCGSLTTFASWNSQMVVMMDGSRTLLGHQIIPALCGYLLGLYCAVSSFLMGRHVSTWLNRWKNPELRAQQDILDHHHDSSIIIDDEESSNSHPSHSHQLHHNDEEENAAAGAAASLEEGQPKTHPTQRSSVGNIPLPPSSIIVYPEMSWIRNYVNGKTIPFVVLGILMVCFILADVTMRNDTTKWYRDVWLSVLLSPLGALLRWVLAKWNSRFTIGSRKWNWIPWGTVTANVVGSLVSILCLAIEMKVFASNQDKMMNQRWGLAFIRALRVGFAGSLSTVSTFVREIVDLASKYPHHAKAYYYATGTICTCATVSLIVYAPIVRS